MTTLKDLTYPSRDRILVTCPSCL